MRFRFTAAVLLAFTALAGCSSEEPQATAPATLNVYTYDAFAADWGPGPKLKALFEAECGCTLNFIALDDSLGILSRIRLEGDKSEADVVLGLDTAIAAGADTRALFAPHGLALADAGLTIPATDPLFVPFDWGAFAFVYNSEVVAQPPASLEELAARPDIKIAIQDPRSSTPGLGLMLWVRSVYGDDAAGYWAKLTPSILTVTKGWSEAYGLLTSGEADMALSYTTSPAYHIIAEQDTRYKAAGFAEGHFMQVEVAGVLKSSGQKELAQDFLTFLISDAAQAVIPTTNWMYPVRGVELPEGFPAPPAPANRIEPDREAIAAHRKAWIAEWLEAVSQ